MMKLKITKMHALGNSYIIIEDLDSELNSVYSDLAIKLSDKNFGIGSDGLLVINKGKDTRFRMRIFNPDGSEAEMCGNGIRMIAKYLFDKSLIGEIEEIEVGPNAKKVKVFIENDLIGVNMGKAEIIEKKEINVKEAKFSGIFANIGNPHFIVFFEDEEKAKRLLREYGGLIEKHEEFPNRTNVEFAFIENKSRISLNVWERGVGITLACGSGACATSFVAYKLGLCSNEVEVKLPGGSLFIRVNEDDTVFMKGPVEYILRGEAYVVGNKRTS